MPTIAYDDFMALKGVNLYAFLEPLLADPTTTISRETLARMLRELATYDEYHLVYALLLGAQHSLETYISEVPQYLVHRHPSVRCTAYNILEGTPARYLTESLVNTVRQMLTTDDARQFAGDLLERLSNRLYHHE